MILIEIVFVRGFWRQFVNQCDVWVWLIRRYIWLYDSHIEQIISEPLYSETQYAWVVLFLCILDADRIISLIVFNFEFGFILFRSRRNLCYSKNRINKMNISGFLFKFCSFYVRKLFINCSFTSKTLNKDWCNASKWLKNDDKSLDTSSAPFEIEREYHKNKDCYSKFQCTKKTTKTHISLNLFAELFNFNDDHKHIFLLLFNSLHAIAQYCQSHSLFTERECKHKEWKKRCYVNIKMVPCPYKDIYQCDDAASIIFDLEVLWI